MLWIETDEQNRPIALDRPRYAADDMLAAARRADTGSVLAALARGEDVNMTDEQTGLSALHLAVASNNIELTKALVEEHGAAFFADGFGRWPSVIAAEMAGVSDELSDYIVLAEARFIDAQSK
ncbi:hypothetical protein DEA8626_01433 [Defluviimonas aquaemixtae]|uniref:Uncharacterized protein n=1 Tax=Albidovulum aquaemixtae TaxID=1542388 RepID=A0A2R8B5N3_9RHOB|nr:ankyrin repeat domain-containing protein [Defluviimonas aquaemixtae]SPH17905.1 hypothetical protein DEA8626_01433 [Defluviimonas aquaemixtae]